MGISFFTWPMGRDFAARNRQPFSLGCDLREKQLNRLATLCSTAIMREEEGVGKDGKRKKKAHGKVPVGLQRL
jgi:hypothetical protein